MMHRNYTTESIVRELGTINMDGTVHLEGVGNVLVTRAYAYSCESFNEVRTTGVWFALDYLSLENGKRGNICQRVGQKVH